MADTKNLMVFACQLAREAGDIMLDYFQRSEKKISVKDNKTLVTEADTKINQLVIDRVKEAYPTHGVLGEEASYRSNRQLLWVCDPIDGTNGFITGEPTSMFSLAYVVDGEPIVAVAYDPYLDRLFKAVKGEGSFCNDTRLQVSMNTSHGALIGGPGGLKELERCLSVYQDLQRAGMIVRLFGGMVYKGCLVAEGRLDGRLFPGLGAHDIAAVKLIVEEAGGTVTAIDGGEQRYDRPIRGAVISNGCIHDELLAAVQTYGPEDFLGF